jgi:phosphoglycerate dehydrogenase-like enzyme
MRMPRVLVSISMHPEALLRLREAAEVEILPWNYPQEQLRPRLDRYDGMIVYVPRMDGDLLDAARNVKVIACHSCPPEVLAAATQRGIHVAVTPTLWDTVADMTVALMFAAARNIPQVDAAIRRGEWGRDTDLKVRFSGRDIFGKTLGILGLGRIGTLVARRVQGFDMRLLYHDPVRKESLEQALRLQYRTLPDLLAESDILIVLSALNDSTRGLLGEAELRSMKRDAILVNTARAAIIDPQALYRALQERWIAAAGLDVFMAEPLQADDPLLTLDNVVVTSHLGGSTKECDMALVEDTLRVLRGQPPLHGPVVTSSG